MNQRITITDIGYMGYCISLCADACISVDSYDTALRTIRGGCWEMRTSYRQQFNYFKTL